MANQTASDITGTGIVEGKVVDHHSRAQTGAQVEVEGTDLVSITDMQGRYSIRGVPPGRRRLTAKMVLGHHTEEVDVLANSVAIVDFVVKPL